LQLKKISAQAFKAIERQRKVKIMESNTETEQQNTASKEMPRWKKWALFCFVYIVTYIFGQALMDIGVIGTKWLLIGPVMLLVYWQLFIKTKPVKVENTIEYNWGKKNK
jgi:hypothetical protein